MKAEPRHADVRQPETVPVTTRPGRSTTGPATRPQLDAARLDELRPVWLASFDEVWVTVRDRHPDPTLRGVDWDAARETFRPQVAEATSPDQARGVMQAMLDLLGESHMSVIPAAAVRSAAAAAGVDPDDDAVAGGAGDVGIDVRLVRDSGGDAKVLVTRVRPDSPADDAGVKTGWTLLEVDGKRLGDIVDTLEAAYGQSRLTELYLAAGVATRLRGGIGQDVPLTFGDEDDNEIAKTFTRVPASGRVTRLGALPPIRVASETRRVEVDGHTLGVFGFSAFLDPEQVGPAFLAAMRDFTGEDPVDAVVVDLRGNLGGLVPMISGLAGLLEAPGTRLGTMTMRGTELNLTALRRSELPPYDGPLAVLIDACSVSAAELMSGGLQSTGRAMVFGLPSAGQALPANARSLSSGDTLMHVVADYVDAAGRRLEGDGVQPDVPVDYDRDLLLNGQDPMLVAVAAWLDAGTPVPTPTPAPATQPATRPATQPATPVTASDDGAATRPAS